MAFDYRFAGLAIALSASLVLPGTAVAQVGADRQHRRDGDHAAGARSISRNSLRTPPDEASITVGTQAKASTATAAVAANKVKTEKLLATHPRGRDPRARHPDSGDPAPARLSLGQWPGGQGHQTLDRLRREQFGADQDAQDRQADRAARCPDHGWRGYGLRAQFRDLGSGAAAARSANPRHGARPGGSDRICAQQRLHFRPPARRSRRASLIAVPTSS